MRTTPERYKKTRKPRHEKHCVVHRGHVDLCAGVAAAMHDRPTIIAAAAARRCSMTTGQAGTTLPYITFTLQQHYTCPSISSVATLVYYMPCRFLLDAPALLAIDHPAMAPWLVRRQPASTDHVLCWGGDIIVADGISDERSCHRHYKDIMISSACCRESISFFFFLK